MKIFGRKYRIDIFTPGEEGITIDNEGRHSLTVKFQFELSSASTANKGWIEIYNLDEDEVGLIDEGMVVEFLAGYSGLFGRVILGDILKGGINPKLTGSDSHVRIEVGDGSRTLESSVIESSFKNGVTVKNLISEIAKSMGLPVNFSGLPDSILSKLTGAAGPQNISGRSSLELRRVLSKIGAAFVVQDQEIVLFQIGSFVQSEAYILDETNSDEPKPVGDGRFEILSVLVPGLRPLRLVEIQHSKNKGLYFIEKVTITGDYAGDTWNSKAVVKPI